MKKLLTIILAMALILPTVSMADSPKITGKWSCYLDWTQFKQNVQDVMDDSLLVYDLYLFEDGTAYLTAMNIPKKTKQPVFQEGALSGTWTGDASYIKINIVPGDTWPAKITDDGYLVMYMTDAGMVFVRVDTTERFYHELTD